MYKIHIHYACSRTFPQPESARHPVGSATWKVALLATGSPSKCSLTPHHFPRRTENNRCKGTRIIRVPIQVLIMEFGEDKRWDSLKVLNLKSWVLHLKMMAHSDSYHQRPNNLTNLKNSSIYLNWEGNKVSIGREMLRRWQIAVVRKVRDACKFVLKFL